MAALTLINLDVGLGPPGIVFDQTQGIRVQKYNPGYPEPRVVEDYRPHQHGMVNYTKYFGAREINIEFMILPQVSVAPSFYTRKVIIDTLRALCNPALRCYLVENMDGVEKRIRVYPSQFDIPYEFTNRNYGQIQWRCPDGYWESATAQPNSAVVGQISAGGTGLQGRLYATGVHSGGDRVYPQGAQVTGGSSITNVGNIETYPIFSLYGPGTAPSIINTSTQKGIYFNAGTVLLQGEFIQVDMRERTVLFNGNINTSWYDKIDWTQSQWFSIGTGVSYLAYAPANPGSGTQATVSWRDNWI